MVNNEVKYRLEYFLLGKYNYKFKIRRLMMYAVIKTGGKQYQVAVGDKLKIEQTPADIGEIITLSEVLMISNDGDVKIGTPLITGATVSAEVINNGRHKKVKIFKMRRRKHFQKHQGHRQNYTEINIISINKGM